MRPNFYRLLGPKEIPDPKIDLMFSGAAFRPAIKMREVWEEREKLCTALRIVRGGDEAYSRAMLLIDQMSRHGSRLTELNNELESKIQVVRGIDELVGDVLRKMRRSRLLNKRRKVEIERLQARLKPKRQIIIAQRRTIRQLRKTCLHLIQEEQRNGAATDV